MRMGSIPHGVTVLMQGPNPGTKPTHGKPPIPALTPFGTPRRIPGSVQPRSPVLTSSVPRRSYSTSAASSGGQSTRRWDPADNHWPSSTSYPPPPTSACYPGDQRPPGHFSAGLSEHRPVPTRVSRASSTIPTRFCGMRSPARIFLASLRSISRRTAIDDWLSDARRWQPVRDRQQHPVPGGRQPNSAQSPPCPTGGCSHRNGPGPQRLRLLSKRNLLDRVGALGARSSTSRSPVRARVRSARSGRSNRSGRSGRICSFSIPSSCS